MPDFAFVQAVFALAGSQEWSVLLKGALLLWIGKEFAWKPVKHIQKKRNGGTEYDQLARQSRLLGDILDSVKRSTEMDAESHAKLITVSREIRAATEEHATTTDKMFRALMGKFDKGHE